jgi:hypothetical protein
MGFVAAVQTRLFHSIALMAANVDSTVVNTALHNLQALLPSIEETPLVDREK